MEGNIEGLVERLDKLVLALNEIKAQLKDVNWNLEQISENVKK